MSSDLRRPLVILGAGTYAIEVLEMAELAGGFAPVAFVVSERVDRTDHGGLPVWHVDDLPPPGTVAITTGIVTTRRRAFVELVQSRGYEFVSIVHPTAVVSPRARIDQGVTIAAGVIVASNTHVGAHVLLNRGANVGHDNHLQPFATIGPGTTLAGGVTVGPGAYVGVGAVVRDHVAIGDGAVVAAGAVVVKPVAARTLVAGCPAMVRRTDVDGL